MEKVNTILYGSYVLLTFLPFIFFTYHKDYCSNNYYLINFYNVNYLEIIFFGILVVGVITDNVKKLMDFMICYFLFINMSYNMLIIMFMKCIISKDLMLTSYILKQSIIYFLLYIGLGKEYNKYIFYFLFSLFLYSLITILLN